MVSEKDIWGIRKDYSKLKLDRDELLGDPIDQFRIWFKDALELDPVEGNAMTLSTVKDNRPSSRIVLLKELDDDGFVFYTNYESRKGMEMAANPNVALVFLWKELQRQVRIEGEVIKLDDERSTKYFQSRPKESQIGAWASEQSSLLQDVSIFKKRIEELQQKYKNNDFLPKPDFWGGYKVVPKAIEFWQGRPSRLHDRYKYSLENGQWKIEQLYP